MKRKKNIDGISIREFVNYYLETNHNCINLRHQGLKSFENPYVIGVSNDFALKYPDSVLKNELIVVIDDYGNPGTYINPNNIKKLIELETAKEKIKLLSNISCYNFEEAAFLYKIWKSLTDDVMYLESLYGYNYDLLNLINKNRVIKQIKKLAKDEAKRTLIFTRMKTQQEFEEVTYSCDSEVFTEEISDSSELIGDDFEYQTTEKVNRQKVLKYNKR